MRFTCMGCEMRLLTEGVDRGAIDAARQLLDAIDARLSRFRPDSELSHLNADPRPTVAASPLLRAAARAALWAAERSRGLVDPTLLGELERAGYTASMAGAPRAALVDALAAAPARAAASARGDERWRAVRIDDAAATITRPPGLRLDTGGTTKGLAADAAARLLGGARRLVVDCGGDLRVAGAPAFDVVVEHPLSGEPAATLCIGAGAVATSGLARRVWEGPRGTVVHHLLDPATGEPAWTGLISATAMAATALEAETRAKTALLGGPAGARRVLGHSGGVLVHDDGTVERVGAAARRSPRLCRSELRPMVRHGRGGAARSGGQAVGPKRCDEDVIAGRGPESAARPALTAISAVNAALPAKKEGRPALTGASRSAAPTRGLSQWAVEVSLAEPRPTRRSRPPGTGVGAAA